MVLKVGAQEVSLPADLRQHNLTLYNSSLFNPAFSLDRNNPQSVSVWTRWQWQSIDADPSTLYLNYTRTLNGRSAAGAAFFQHNTGVYYNTGGVLNYAYKVEFNPLIKLSFGANLFGFVQKLADDRFVIDPQIPFPQIQNKNDFILQFAPGANLMIENFSFSIASENLFDFNFTDKGSNTNAAYKIFMGMVSYDFPVMTSDSTAFLRPSIYLRTIPLLENQIGLNALLSTQKYWAQLGYNNFYGIGIGGGGTILNRYSLGAIVEFGTSSSLNSKNPSFEFVASYFIDNPETRRKSVLPSLLEEEKVLPVKEEITEEKPKEDVETVNALALEKEAQQEEEQEKALAAQEKEKEKQEIQEAKALAAQEKAIEKQKKKDSVALVKEQKEALALAKKQEEEQQKITTQKTKNADAIADAQRLKEQQRVDSISKAKASEALALNQQRITDSINNAKAAELEAAQKEAQENQVVQKTDTVVKPEAGEKYEEVATEGSLEPGFYLIANVFGTQKYFEAFINDLIKKGLQPKSFLREQNNYNYVYLERYNTMAEARRARESKFGGRYTEKTWIFRVVGQ